MQFRLSTLFWVIFVFAASMSLAGVWGVPLALYWVIQWWLAAGKARKYGARQAIAEMLAVTAVLALVLWCLIPSSGGTRTAARRIQCAGHLKQIGLALENYRSQWKCLPPAIVYDASGRPLHTWRTLILPYMEHFPLYSACDMRLPWNEGVNASALGKKLGAYTCPSEIESKDGEDLHTSYVAVVGPGTVWDPATKPPPKDTRIVAAEMANSGIAWAEPKDLSLDEALAAIEEEDPGDAFPRSKHPHGFNMLLADGSVRLVSAPVSRRLLQVLVIEGDDDAEGHRDAIERDSQPLRQRWQEQLDEAERRVRLLTALAFVVWVVSVVGFGVHAFRVRWRRADEASKPSPSSPEDIPPADASRPDDAAGA